MATAVARDQRLGRAAVAIAVLLVAQAGGSGVASVTRTYLARTLGYSGRTIARGLAELRAAGYIRTEHRIGQIGQTTGLRCWLLPALLPFWETPVTLVTSHLMPIQNLRLRGLQEELHGCVGVEQKQLPLARVEVTPSYLRRRPAVPILALVHPPAGPEYLDG